MSLNPRDTRNFLLRAAGFLAVLIVVGPVVAQSSFAPLAARVSVKRIVTPQGDFPPEWDDECLVSMVDEASRALMKTANVALVLTEIVDVVDPGGAASWFNLDAQNRAGYEATAEANAGYYAWRSDAINVYCVDTAALTLFPCLFPTGDSGQADMVVITPNVDDGVRFAHEICHFFNLRHTHANYEPSIGGCGGAAGDCVADTPPDSNPLPYLLANDFDWQDLHNTDLENLGYSIANTELLEFNIMSYHGPIDAYDALLSTGQVMRMRNAATSSRAAVVSVREFQTNQPLAGLTLDGVEGTVLSPAFVGKNFGDTVFASLTADPFEYGFHFVVLSNAPPVAYSSGSGYLTIDGQLGNIDLNSQIQVVPVGYWGGDLFIPFVTTFVGTLTIQRVQLTDSYPSGIALSQAVRLDTSGPPGPQGLTAVGVSLSSVQLNWQDSATGEIAYRVARLDPGESESNPTLWDNDGGNLPPNTTSYTSTGLVSGGTYKFKVRYQAAAGYYSEYGNTVTITVPYLPSAPSNLSATATSTTSVTLGWQDNADNETEYRVARLDPGEDPNNASHWDNIAVLGANATSLAVGGLIPGGAYQFRVRCAHQFGFSPYSNVAVVTLPVPVPNGPTGLTGIGISASQIQLNWIDNATDETEYRVAQLNPGLDPNNAANWNNVAVLAPNTSGVVVGGLSPGLVYQFRVRCYNGYAYSAYSNIVSASPPIPPIAAPTSLSGIPTAQTSVQLFWIDNATNETEYRVAQLDPGEDPNNPAHWDNVAVLGANATSVVINGLAAGQTYQFKVRAGYPYGYSGYSNIAAVTTCPPTPSAPTNCVAQRQGANTSAPQPILVSWLYSGPPVSGFRVARLDPGENANDPSAWDNVGGDLPSTATSYLNSTGLINGQTYYYKVRAFIDGPCGRVYGDYSNVDGANP